MAENPNKDLNNEDKSSANQNATRRTHIPPNPRKPQMSEEQTRAQLILEKRLGVIKLLDYVVHDPFQLIFQNALMEKYQKELLDPVFKTTTSSDINHSDPILSVKTETKQYYEDNKIDGKFKKILEKSEKIAEDHGIHEPYLKRVQKTMIKIMVGILGTFFITMFFFQEASNVAFYIMLFPCLCQRQLQSSYQKKWQVYKAMFYKELQDTEPKTLQDVKNFNQLLLNDLRELLINLKLPLQAINFMMLSNDYKNVKTINTRRFSGTTQFVVQFEYPIGVAPPVMTSQNSQLGDSQVKDVFIVLKNPVFNINGELVEFELYYPKPILAEGIENLLERAQFKHVDKPKDIIAEYPTVINLKCSCGNEAIILTDMRYCTIESKSIGQFEFYLGVGGICTCGSETFVVFASPGNENTPKELRDIFGEIKDKEEEEK